MKKESKKMFTTPMHLSIVILLIVNLLISTFGLFNVKMQLNKIEETKVGGHENYQIRQELVETEAFKDGTKSYLEQQLMGSQQAQEQVQEQGQEQIQVQQPTEIQELPEVDLSDETIKTLENNLKGAYIEGNKNSDIIILEYSELLCPYCKRQHNAGIVNAMIEKYDVAATFRHFIVHPPTATQFAMGAECAGQQNGQEGYLNYIHEVFQINKLGADSMTEVATKLELDMDEFTACLSDEDLNTKIDNQTAEGRTLFEVAATPRSIIVNTKTQKMISIRGAQPQTAFEAAIEQLQK